LTVPRPLVVFTPKSMLRNKRATSETSELTSGTFAPVIGDAALDPAGVERVLLCSGKITWDLIAERDKRRDTRTAIARLEQLYPLPSSEIEAELRRYPNLQEIRWVQDEPENQGPWPYVALHLPQALDQSLSAIARPESASPSVGSHARHVDEQKLLLKQAFE
jgi:multifunctional 2-oxoglutarate metabolism enzyme